MTTEEINLEAKMNAIAFYEILLENISNNKKVGYNAIRHLPLVMAIRYTSTNSEYTYIQWIDELLEVCYRYNHNFYAFGLNQAANGIMAVARALCLERERVTK